MSNSSDSGYLKFHRSADATNLLRYPNAFALLAKIAMQANWQPEANEAGLRQGQCFVGDWKSIGMTEGEYRSAKKFLTQLGYAKFQGRGQNGTVATLTSQTIFDLNLGWVVPKPAERIHNGFTTDSLTDSGGDLSHSKSITSKDKKDRYNGLNNGFTTDSERLIKNLNELNEGANAATDGADAPVTAFVPMKGMEAIEQYNQRVEAERRERLMEDIREKELEQAEENKQSDIENRESNELYPELPSLRQSVGLPPLPYAQVPYTRTTRTKDFKPTPIFE